MRPSTVGIVYQSSSTLKFNFEFKFLVGVAAAKIEFSLLIKVDHIEEDWK